jgi:hypothetical protein
MTKLKPYLKKYRIFFPLVLIAFTYACNTTKYLDEREQLLVKNKIKIKSEEKKSVISEDELKDVIRPRPNSRLLFMRVNLAIYNIYSPEKTARKEKKKEKKCEEKQLKKLSEYDSDIRRYEYNRSLYPEGTKEYKEYDEKLKSKQEKRNKLKNEDCDRTLWTHRIGEAPVLYKTNDQYRNARQIRIYLKNRGYYYPSVRTDKTNRSKKKAEVEYIVKPGKPYRIDSVTYDINDDSLQDLILKHEDESFIKKGSRLDVDFLQNERNRISEILRNRGYYHFTKNFISYSIDTIGPGMKADVEMKIAKPVKNGKPINHRKYLIQEVNIWPDYEPRKALTDKQDYLSKFTEKKYLYNNKPFVFHKADKPKLKSSAIMHGIYINKDSLYRVQDIRATYKYLTGMEIIKIANVDFSEITDSTNLPYKYDPEKGYLECDIRISNNASQARTFEIQGTNTNGNLGAAGSATYTHRNIFRGAEVFNFGLRGSLERQTNYAGQDAIETDQFFNSQELSVEAGIKFPRFLAPLKLKRFIKRSNPGTEILLNYSYLHRPEYTRTVAGFSYGYFWKSSQVLEHLFKPVVLDYVDLIDPTDGFLEYIARYNLQGSYEDHFVFGSSYSLIFNNSGKEKKSNYFYLRTNTKLAGNSLSAAMTLIQGDDSPGKSINNNVFAQFFKLDFDLRHYRLIPGTDNKIVFRLFSGAAFPYGNLDVVPFGEKYFSGGANGVRAWQVRALGPGAYTYQDEADRFPNRTADIKIEGNIEYRMKLFWMIEGALFVDAGNIWAINETDDREGALFELSDFHKEIAIGTGLGFRFDFDFFIIRLDFGLKLKDPSMEEGKRWIPLNRSYNYDDWTFNIGIGYPF